MTEVSPSSPQQQQQQRRETRSSKTKDMIKAIPPSPALSHAEMPVHGLPTGHTSDYLQHHHQTSTAYYPQEQSVNMESIHARSQPATRYSTPVPPRSLYQSANQQLVQQYPQYSYPQPPQQYDHSPYTFADDYGTAVSISSLEFNPSPVAFSGQGLMALTTYQSSQPYSTPATSPPTPSRNTEVRVTRNGTYPRGGKAPTVSRPPAATSTPKKKAGKDRPKAVKKSPHLSGPMSEITKDSHIPVIDIGTYVHRSTEDRIREVATGKIPGKIKRPMNAFMLYRKAYQNRAKEWCSQHNHQVVSQVCGDSWPLEPDHVRAQFTEWAKLERDNHQKAHPSYKFTPSKPHKPKPVAAAKRGRAEDDEDDDPDDPDWRGSTKRMRRMHTPLDDEEYQDPRSLYGGQGGYQQHNRSAFHASNPGKPMPQPYDTHAAAAGHYYQTVQVRDGAVEHIMYKKTPSPAMMHHQQHHHGGYEMSAYGPPPPQMHPQSHHHHYQQQQYLDTQHLQHHPSPQYSPQRVDPSLLPSGTAGDLLDLGGGGYGQYPHQMDPAQWHDGQGGGGGGGQQQVYLDQTTTFEIGQYALPGDEFGDPAALLAQPEQEKIFNQEPWQVLDTSLAAEGDDWMEKFELQPATAGQLEGVSELERK
jgi:hypothetical protein